MRAMSRTVAAAMLAAAASAAVLAPSAWAQAQSPAVAANSGRADSPACTMPRPSPSRIIRISRRRRGWQPRRRNRFVRPAPPTIRMRLRQPHQAWRRNTTAASPPGGQNNPIIYDRFARGITVGQLVTDFGRTHEAFQERRPACAIARRKTSCCRARMCSSVRSRLTSTSCGPRPCCRSRSKP